MGARIAPAVLDSGVPIPCDMLEGLEDLGIVADDSYACTVTDPKAKPRITARALRRALGGPKSTRGALAGAVLAKAGRARRRIDEAPSAWYARAEAAAASWLVELEALALGEADVPLMTDLRDDDAFMAANAKAMAPRRKPATHGWRTEFLSDISRAHREIIEERPDLDGYVNVMGMLAITAATESTSRSEAFQRLGIMREALDAKAQRAIAFEDEQNAARVRADLTTRAAGVARHIDPRGHVVESEPDPSHVARIGPNFQLLPSPAEQAAQAEREARDAGERERLRAERAAEDAKIEAVEERHAREDKHPSVMGVPQVVR
jgi:hypothetical protein